MWAQKLGRSPRRHGAEFKADQKKWSLCDTEVIWKMPTGSSQPSGPGVTPGSVEFRGAAVGPQPERHRRAMTHTTPFLLQKIGIESPGPKLPPASPRAGSGLVGPHLTPKGARETGRCGVAPSLKLGISG